MEVIDSPLDFIIANPDDFDLKLVCQFINVDTHIDSSFSVGRQYNIHYFDKELDCCIYFDAVAFNVFEKFAVTGRVSFGEDRDRLQVELKRYRDFQQKSEAVLITSQAYTLVNDEVAVYDSEIHGLGFPFGD